MMTGGKMFAAEKLLEELAKFSWDYRRNADYIEALTLRAICLWRISQTKEAVEIFAPAIIRAAQLQLTMPIVKNGGEILPVLQKVQNRLKYGYDADILDKTFVNRLYMQAREQSKHRSGTMLFRTEKPITLSPRQAEVIDCLALNLSYQEIGEKMGVTTSAVDYHIRILHGKFGVSNTRDLLQKARELSVINIE
jgi:DNA-binding CsgD family transcriptional regulator